MSRPEVLSVVQAGVTAPESALLRDIIADHHVPLRLEAVAVSEEQSELVGRRLGETALDGRSAHRDVPVISLEDAIDNTNAPLIVSGLQGKEAEAYERRLAEGRWLMTAGSARGAAQPNLAWFNAYINGDQLEELHSQPLSARVIASGSPMSIIAGVALAPLHREFGIERLGIETLQGWSETGWNVVRPGHEGGISPIDGREAESLTTELDELLGSLSDPADIAVAARLNRAPWVRGNHAKLKVTLDRPAKHDEIEEVLYEATAPEQLRRLHYDRRYRPCMRPIKHVRKLLQDDRSELFKLAKVKPMSVGVQVRKTNEEKGTVKLSVAGDNLVIGGAGSMVMNAVYAQARGYIS